MAEYLPCLIADKLLTPAGGGPDGDYPLTNPYHHADCPKNSSSSSSSSQGIIIIRSCSNEQVAQALAFASHISEYSDVCSFNSLQQRFEALKIVAAAIGAEQEEYAQRDAVETGIPLPVQRMIVAGLEPCASDFLESAMTCLTAKHKVPGKYGTELVGFRRPVGPVAILVPFNVPAGTIVPKLFVALLCGCPVIIKPSPVAAQAVTKMLLTMHRVLAECSSTQGFASLLQVVHGGADVGTQLVGSPLIRAVQFTGAPATATAVARSAGMKPLLAECGGANAVLVAEGADLTCAVRYTASSLLTLNGQWCLGTSRIFVHESLRDAFVRKLQRYLERRVRVFFDPHAAEGFGQQPSAEEMMMKAASTVSGTGSDAAAVLIELGCLCSEHQASRVREAMARVASTSKVSDPLLPLFDIDAVWRGAAAASSVCSSCESKGNAPLSFMSPTLILEPDVLVAAQNEFFGPCASLHTFADSQEALRGINMSPGMLGCAVFSMPEKTAMHLGSKIRNSTMVFLNSHNFAHEVGEGHGELPVTFSGSSGLGRDGNGAVLAQFFSACTYVGVSGDQDHQDGHVDDHDDDGDE